MKELLKENYSVTQSEKQSKGKENQAGMNSPNRINDFVADEDFSNNLGILSPIAKRKRKMNRACDADQKGGIEMNKKKKHHGLDNKEALASNLQVPQQNDVIWRSRMQMKKVKRLMTTVREPPGPTYIPPMPSGSLNQFA